MSDIGILLSIGLVLMGLVIFDLSIKLISRK